MAEVYLNVHDVAAALGLSYYTVSRYVAESAREDTGDGRHIERRFPHARLLFNSRRKGYRIPASDVLAYAAQQGDDVVAQAERVIEKVRAREQAKLSS